MQGNCLSNRILVVYSILIAAVLALAPLGGRAAHADGESIAGLIQSHTVSQMTVTVDDTQYYILLLGSYIDPVTLQVSSSSNIIKAYTDTAYNPVSSETLAQKIGIIDFARRISQLEGLGTSEGLQCTIQNMRQRLYYHYVIRFAETLLNVGAREMAIAIRGYVTAGTSIPHDAILGAVDTAASLLGDPMNTLEAIVYLDFSNAEEHYEQAAEVAGGGGIVSYEDAYRYLHHFLHGNAYQYPAFYMLNELDSIESSIAEELAEFAAEVGDEIVKGIYGNVVALLDDLKLVSGVASYVDRGTALFSQAKDKLSDLNSTARYTLALAQRSGAAEDTSPPQTSITSGPLGTITSHDVTFNWTASDADVWTSSVGSADN